VTSTPLEHACEDGHVDAIRALIELGADATDGDLLEAAGRARDEQSAAEITRLLLAAGADPNGPSRFSSSGPLHSALHAACVDVLVEAGADIEARDSSKRTPIYNAVDWSMKRNQEEDEEEETWGDPGTVALRLADLGADLVNTGGEPGLVECHMEELRRRRAAKSGGGSRGAA